MDETLSEGIVKEAGESPMWIEDDLESVNFGDRIETALDHWCGIKDVKVVYIRKAGNHLEVGKAEIHCIE